MLVVVVVVVVVVVAMNIINVALLQDHRTNVTIKTVKTVCGSQYTSAVNDGRTDRAQ